jgi:hypothetical protein
MNEKEHDQNLQPEPIRGTDDRRHDVRPTDNPAPSSPQADDEAVRKGVEMLERVKPY